MIKNKVIVIAEAGVNHNGKLKTALRLVDAASKIGADMVKFQTFTAKNLVSPSTQKANYQKKNTTIKETHYEMIKNLELSLDDHKKIVKHCKKRNIEFLSSPFDLPSIQLLESIKIRKFKIPSGEITNLPYLRAIGKVAKQIILSTGMSNMIEIDKALKVLLSCGMSKKNIIVLHCNSEYPTLFRDVNLRSMVSIKNKFNVKIGYSDHTLGIEVSIAAVAMGALVIEKHFTLNKKDKGPDHKSSLEPNEFYRMIKSIRNIETAFGNHIKKPTKSEKKNMPIARKSIIAKTDIIKGEIFTKENLCIKRPGTGISPMRWDKIIGRKSKKNFKINDLIKI